MTGKPIKKYEWDNHSKRLEFDDFVPIGRSLALGSSVRINHLSKHCEGESASIKIRRSTTGLIFAKCYRCNKIGIFKRDMERQLPRKVDGRYFSNVEYEEVQNKPIELPKDIIKEIDKWPINAKAFIRKARIDDVQVMVRGIGYSPSLGKVVLPLYSYDRDANKDGGGSKLIGYQLRRVFDEDTSPKYTTRKNAKDYFAHSHKTDTVCCVVEDYLSFIRCSKFVSTVCLFGTNMSHAVTKHLAGYDKVIVFLDNDNNIVKRKQMEMQRELENWVDEVIIISSDKQPKEYTDNDLVFAMDVPY